MHTSLRVTGVLSDVGLSVVIGLGFFGRTALKRIVLGSVLARLAHTCSRALLIAPVASEASGT